MLIVDLINRLNNMKNYGVHYFTMKLLIRRQGRRDGTIYS